jgi:hypothetical protein
MLMKKLIPIAAAAAFFLNGCAGLNPLLDLIATPTVIPPDTATPQPTVTLFPTNDLFATLTPTPVTFTPTTTPFVPDQTETSTPLPTATLKPPSTFAGDSIFTPQNQGFLTILLSGGFFYWNSGPCSPRTIKVTAFVGDIIHTDHVLLSMRPREKSDTMLLGDWSYMQMLPGDNGSFSYEVGAINIRKYYWFIEAWVEYQLISYDDEGKELARSQVFDKTLSLVMCRPINP